MQVKFFTYSSLQNLLFILILILMFGRKFLTLVLPDVKRVFLLGLLNWWIIYLVSSLIIASLMKQFMSNCNLQELLAQIWLRRIYFVREMALLLSSFLCKQISHADGACNCSMLSLEYRGWGEFVRAEVCQYLMLLWQAALWAISCLDVHIFCRP